MGSIFKRLIWGSKERISSNKLNDMVSNDDYLYEHMIGAYYDHNGIVRDSGLEMRVGSVPIPNFNGIFLHVEHYFKKPFLPGVKPIILTGLMSDGPDRIFCATMSLDGNAQPDHRGFTAHFSSSEWQNDGTVYQGVEYLTYIAMAPSVA